MSPSPGDGDSDPEGPGTSRPDAAGSWLPGGGWELPRVPRVFESRAARRGALARAAALAAVVGLLGAGLVVAVPGLTDPDRLRARIGALGPWAPVAFVALEAVQVVVAPIPGQVLAGVGGYLFGGPPGAAYSLAGVVAGSAVAFGLARRYGRPYVERVVAPAALDRWDGFVAANGVPGLFALFLFPAFPDDLLCLVAGLSEVRARTFLAIVAVGRAPSFVAAAYAGSGLAAGRLRAAVALLAALAVLSLVVALGRERLVAALDRLP